MSDVEDRPVLNNTGGSGDGDGLGLAPFFVQSESAGARSWTAQDGEHGSVIHINLAIAHNEPTCMRFYRHVSPENLIL